MKVLDFISLLISLIFMVMGILILSHIILADTYFDQNGFMRIILGLIFLMYGGFRGYKAFMKFKYGRKEEDIEI